jgi:hypothetical protein
MELHPIEQRRRMKHSMQPASQSPAPIFIGRPMALTSIPLNRCGRCERVRSTVDNATLPRNSPSSCRQLWLPSQLNRHRDGWELFHSSPRRFAGQCLIGHRDAMRDCSCTRRPDRISPEILQGEPSVIRCDVAGRSAPVTFPKTDVPPETQEHTEIALARWRRVA